MIERMVEVTITVNGEPVSRRIEARQHLVDFLREVNHGATAPA